MINSRNISDLNPKLQTLCVKFVSACEAHNIDILITSTYRDAESQNAIYATGRTTKGANPTASNPMGSILTNAKAGQSFHNYRIAFDFVPLKNGKAIWNDLALFTQCGEIAESVGLEWAGRWTKFKEMAHCQYTGGLTLKDFQAGKQF